MEERVRAGPGAGEQLSLRQFHLRGKGHVAGVGRRRNCPDERGRLRRLVPLQSDEPHDLRRQHVFARGLPWLVRDDSRCRKGRSHHSVLVLLVSPEQQWAGVHGPRIVDGAQPGSVPREHPEMRRDRTMFKKTLKLCASLAAVLCMTGHAHAAATYQSGHISNVTFSSTSVLIMLDTGLPDNCVGSPYGWMVVPDSYKSMAAFVIGLWMRGDQGQVSV